MSASPLLFCFCILIKALLAEGCSANQQSLATLTAPNGTVPSHHASAKPLPFNATCQWLIKAPQGKVLRLEVRIATFTGSCDDQYLKIYDGPSASSKMIAEYCSKRRPFGDYFISSNQNLWLEMKSGIWRSYMSWSYQTLDKEECSINTTLDAPQWPEEHNFSSPYWPHGYRINSTCGWYIKAPRDHIVKLHITSELFEFPLDKAVQIYDVENWELSLVHRPRRDRGIVFSKLQGIYVLFKTDDMVHTNYEKGIFVSYTSISPGKECLLSNTEGQNMNIMLKNSSGIFKTPGFPGDYPHILINECVWKIVAATGKVVKVAFSSFQLFQYDCVTIVDGINTADPIIDTRCGSEASFTVYSSGPEMTIKTRGLYTDDTGPGFMANYTMIPGLPETACIMSQDTVAHLSGEGKTFYTPDFPSNPGRGTCSWNITVPDGMFVKLTLQAQDCDKTYTEVFDGPTFFSRSLGTFCIQHKKDVVYSSGRSLVVRFNSSRNDSSNSGLLASYEALPAIPVSYACSENTRWYEPIALKDAQNSFASYDFPLNYPNGASCHWKIESSVGYVIQVTFDAFNLQNSNSCQSDYVEVRETSDGRPSTLIGRFCGSSSPGVFTSNYSTLLVEFVSDMSGRYPGFRATAMARPNPAMGACKVQGVDNVIRLTNETGRLFSPLFPLQYPKDMTCTWIITVPEGHFVRLKMKSFQLSVDCDDAHLEIRDGDSSASKLLNKFCFRNYDISIFSSGQHLWVRFKSVHTFSYDFAGFDAVFEAVTQVPASFACTASNSRATLKADSGTLASYNFPLPYDDPIQCVWVILVSHDRHVKLSFDFFNVSASSSSCDDDFVEVRDGPFDTSDLVGKYCGAEKPPEITSSDWDLRVEFKSSGKTRHPGFKATYETKKTIGAIMKIVGIVVGALSAVCTVIGACCKYCGSSGGHAIQETEGITQTESIPLQENDTKA